MVVTKRNAECVCGYLVFTENNTEKYVITRAHIFLLDMSRM